MVRKPPSVPLRQSLKWNTPLVFRLGLLLSDGYLCGTSPIWGPPPFVGDRPYVNYTCHQGNNVSLNVLIVRASRIWYDNIRCMERRCFAWLLMNGPNCRWQYVSIGESFSEILAVANMFQSGNRLVTSSPHPRDSVARREKHIQNPFSLCYI